MTGEWHPEVLAGLAGLGGLYVWRARAQRSPLPLGRALAFATGLVVIAGALNGPLHDLADRYLFSAHMAQHLLLILVVPPLLLAGLAPGMLAPLLRHEAFAHALAAVSRPPVAFLLYNVALVAWHLPVAYGVALEHHPLHIVQHLTFMATAVLAWWPVLSPEPQLRRAPYPAQVLYLFLLGLPMTAVAAMITMADHALYAFYAEAPRIVALSAVEDQRLGGLLMWVPASLAPLAAFTTVFFRWAHAEREDD